MMNSEIRKVIILGDEDVGRKSLIRKLRDMPIDSKMSHSCDPWNVTDFAIKKMTVNNKQIRMFIYNDDRSRVLPKWFFYKVNGCIIMYDITSEISFNHVQKWIKMVRENIKNVPIVLLGNKVDKADKANTKDRQVKKEVAQQFAKDNNVLWFETSMNSKYDPDVFLGALFKLI
jgi:Ras-related protein Rab-13